MTASSHRNTRYCSMVCPYVCRVSHSSTLLKLLDEKRCHLAGTLAWSQVTRGPRYPDWKESFGVWNPEFAAMTPTSRLLWPLLLINRLIFPESLQFSLGPPNMNFDNCSIRSNSYGPDYLPVAEPTASKHRRITATSNQCQSCMTVMWSVLTSRCRD